MLCSVFCIILWTRTASINRKKEPGEMVQHLRAHTAHPEDQSSVPHTHTGWLAHSQLQVQDQALSPLATTDTYRNMCTNPHIDPSTWFKDKETKSGLWGKKSHVSWYVYTEFCTVINKNKIVMLFSKVNGAGNYYIWAGHSDAHL